MKRLQFMVVIEKDQATGLYVGEVPGLPGAHSQGKTIDELIVHMKEVIALVLEVHHEDAAQLPEFVGIQRVEVAA